MATLREFVTKWGFDVDDSQLKKIDQGVSRAQKNIRATAKAAVSLGKGLSLGVTLPFVAGSAAAIKFASDAEETQQKFGVVFKEVSKEAEATAKSLAAGYGLAQDESKELLANTGDLLSGFGFSGESALQLSTDVQKLAVDLASFTNFSGGAAGASAALTKALLGERESVKSLGISILEEDVKKEVALLRTKGMTFETERQAKAQATLNIAMRQSKNAIGDFSRSSKSFANQTRIMNAAIRDVTVQFGQILLPIATKVVGKISQLVQWFGSLSQGTKTAILVIGGLAAAIGPLLIITGLMVQSFLSIRLALQLVGSAAIKSFAIILFQIILVVAAVSLIAIVFNDLKAFFEGRDSVFGVIINSIDELLFKFQESFPILSRIVLGFVSVVGAPIRAVVGLVRGLSAALGTLFGGGGALNALKSFGSEFGGAFSGVTKAFSGEKIGSEDLLSVGGIRRKPGEGVASPTSTTANVGQTNNTSVTVNATTGASAQDIGKEVEGAVRRANDPMLRETNRQVAGAIAN